MLRPVIRTLSMLEQWASEVVREPALMFTLVVAPFLLLFAFGQGVELGGPRPVTEIVQPADSNVDLSYLLERVDRTVELTGVSESLPLARQALERGDIDAIVVVPEDPESYIEAGEQIPILVYIGEIDPVRRSYARSYMRDQISLLNQASVTEVIAEAQASMGDVGALTADARTYVAVLSTAREDLGTARTQVTELRQALDPLADAIDRINRATGQAAFFVPGLGQARQQVQQLQGDMTRLRENVDRLDARLQQADSTGGLPTDAEIRELESSLTSIEGAARDLSLLPPEVLSAPFRLEMENVTKVTTSFTAFYSPGMLALLIQHLAITLGALTMARMRTLRVTDMLRIAPIRPVEVVTGSYVSYTLLSAIVAVLLFASLILFLDVPVAGSYFAVAGMLLLLILCSLGIGFVISLISQSLQQAVQGAMLILLGSIFFSGFAFSLDQIAWPVRLLSNVFPATYGIRTLQDVMLRGLIREPLDFVILGVAALVLFLIAVLLMRRELRAE